MNQKSFSRLFVCFFCALSVCTFCGKKTDEDLILDMVDSLGRLAEKKDLETIMAHFADDFSDFEGRDKAGLQTLLVGYFSGRSGIVVHRLSSQVEMLAADQASLQTEVALSSGGAEALRRLIKISPENYRLKIGLVKSGERWLIQSAEWSEVDLNELFPESLIILRKIYSR